jgi:hypothetical protein
MIQLIGIQKIEKWFRRIRRRKEKRGFFFFFFFFFFFSSQTGRPWLK